MTEQKDYTKYKEELNEKAKKVKTKEELNKFIDEVTTYQHDYSSIVYGIAAVMDAAFRVVNESAYGGITGFQAGCLGWELVHKYMMVGYPCKIVDYNHMLYPQYVHDFEKTISKDVWTELQEKAKKNLSEQKVGLHETVKNHWQSIANGTVPFGYTVKEN